MTCAGSDFALTVRQAAPISLNAEISCHGGELLALVGPSGSGKSTLLRTIAGLYRPGHGRITCGNKCWFDHGKGINLPPQQRHVGFVPQHYGLFPHMTALHNVMAGLTHLPSKPRKERAVRWLSKVHLSGLEQRRPAELSGGQQQRVALARALAREPAILLLDEPFSAVDRATRETLYIELAELKRELALPIIMVTHDLNEALLLADRMTLLSRGHTLQSGPPHQVLARPVNETAARLLGIRNLFDGEVLRHDPQAGLTWLKAGDTEIAGGLAEELAPGSQVRWMIPGSGVRLRSAVRGDLPVGVNHLRITVKSVLPLGEDCRVTALLPGINAPLHLQIPLRLVQQLTLAQGTRTDAVLLDRQLHIFAP